MSNNATSVTTINVFSGGLIRNLVERNQSWFSDLGLVPKDAEICAPISSSFSTDDLRNFARLSETLRAFEVLVIHTYLTSDQENKEQTANSLLRLIPIQPITPELEDQHLPQYVQLSDAIRSFEVVAFFHYLNPESERELIAQKINESVEHFYQQAVGLNINGEVNNCDGLCPSGTKCVMCTIPTDEVMKLAKG